MGYESPGRVMSIREAGRAQAIPAPAGEGLHSGDMALRRSRPSSRAHVTERCYAQSLSLL